MRKEQALLQKESMEQGQGADILELRALSWLAFEDNVLNPSSDKNPIVIHNTTGDGEPHKEASKSGAENNPQHSFLEGQ